MILLEFMKKFHGLVCVFFGITENRMCLFIGFSENTFFSFIQFFLFFLEGFFQLFYLFFVTGNFSTFVFDGDSALLQGCQNIFKRFILLTDLLFCLVDDEIRKSQFGRNGKCVTFSGNSDQETVGGA